MVCLLFRVKDKVASSRMTIKGVICQEKSLIEIPYGKREVKTNKLAGIVFRVVGPRSKTIGMAATYQPSGNWLNSKIGLDKGQRFTIATTGQVSVSNYGITTGPDGSRQYSSNRARGGFPILSLVGKVGKPFLISSKNARKTERRPYLGVVPFYYQPEDAGGTHRAKVNLGTQKIVQSSTSESAREQLLECVVGVVSTEKVPSQIDRVR